MPFHDAILVLGLLICLCGMNGYAVFQQQKWAAGTEAVQLTKPKTVSGIIV